MRFRHCSTHPQDGIWLSGISNHGTQQLNGPADSCSHAPDHYPSMATSPGCYERSLHVTCIEFGTPTGACTRPAQLAYPVEALHLYLTSSRTCAQPHQANRRDKECTHPITARLNRPPRDHWQQCHLASPATTMAVRWASGNKHSAPPTPKPHLIFWEETIYTAKYIHCPHHETANIRTCRHIKTHKKYPPIILGAGTVNSTPIATTQQLTSYTLYRAESEEDQQM